MLLPRSWRRLAAACFTLAASLASPAALHAQSFTLPNSATLTPLLTAGPGHSFGGVEADSHGNIYFFDVDVDTADADGDLGTRLRMRNASGFVSTLHTFASEFGYANYGTVLRLQEQAGAVNLYFGEYNNGGIYRGTLALGDTALSGTALVATLGTTYDLALSPVGQGYISASPAGLGKNELFRATFNASTPVTPGNGITTLVADMHTYSGPLVFDDVGNLFYSAPSSADAAAPAKGIYRIPTSALAGTTPFTLDAAWLVSSDSPTGLDFFDGRLFATLGSNVVSYDLANGFARTDLGTVGGYFSGIAGLDGLLYFTASDFNYPDTHTAIYMVAVPEPGSALLLSGGLMLLGLRRWRSPTAEERRRFRYPRTVASSFLPALEVEPAQLPFYPARPRRS